MPNCRLGNIDQKDMQTLATTNRKETHEWHKTVGLLLRIIKH